MKYIIRTYCPAFALLCLASILPAAPIHQAIKAHDTKLVARIIEEEGPDALNATVASGITPLHMAAALGHMDTTSLLISGGADIMARTQNGFTPLHWAAGMNKTETTELLLDMGAAIDATAHHGITPLHWAASRDAVATVQVLIERGADITLKTTRGLTPLHWAVMKDASDSAAVLAALTVEKELDEPPPKPPKGVAPPLIAAPPADAVNTVEPGVTGSVLPVTDGAVGDEWRIDIGGERPLVFRRLPDSGLWFGQFEISNEQYRRFQPEHNSLRVQGLSLNEPHQPAVYVSWQAANAFCEWLNRHFAEKMPENFIARLPDSTEWQIAAQCGGERIYPWGNEWPPSFGNFSDISAGNAFSEWPYIDQYDDGQTTTCDVKECSRNEWGLYGMAGNVWEWCRDWYDANEENKIRLGGAWDTFQEELARIKHRGFDRPTARYDSIGFRVVLAGN